MHKDKREEFRIKEGHGTAGKAAVVVAKDRETGNVQAQVVYKTDKETLQAVVAEYVAEGGKV